MASSGYDPVFNIREDTFANKENSGDNKRKVRWNRIIIFVSILLTLYYLYYAYITIITTKHKDLTFKLVMKNNPATKHLKAIGKTAIAAGDKIKDIYDEVQNDKDLKLEKKIKETMENIGMNKKSSEKSTKELNVMKKKLKSELLEEIKGHVDKAKISETKAQLKETNAHIKQHVKENVMKHMLIGKDELKNDIREDFDQYIESTVRHDIKRKVKKTLDEVVDKINQKFDKKLDDVTATIYAYVDNQLKKNRKEFKNDASNVSRSSAKKSSDDKKDDKLKKNENEENLKNIKKKIDIEDVSEDPDWDDAMKELDKLDKNHNKKQQGRSTLAPAKATEAAEPKDKDSKSQKVLLLNFKTKQKLKAATEGSVVAPPNGSSVESEPEQDTLGIQGDNQNVL